MAQKSLDTSTFIEQVVAIHGDKYDYSKTDYKTARIKVEIICKKHQISFWITPNKHKLGKGCNICGCERQAEKVKLSQEEFEDKANNIHNFKFDYSNTIYLGHRNDIIVNCPLHGTWTTKAASHLRGTNCPSCTLLDKKGMGKFAFIHRCKNKPGILYIAKLHNDLDSFIKVGITSNSLLQRNPSAGKYRVEKILEIKDNPDKIFDLETLLHEQLAEYKYQPLIEFGGHTECYNKSVLPEIQKLLQLN